MTTYTEPATVHVAISVDLRYDLAVAGYDAGDDSVDDFASAYNSAIRAIGLAIPGMFISTTDDPARICGHTCGDRADELERAVWQLAHDCCVRCADGWTSVAPRPGDVARVERLVDAIRR
jgi:hypothetical protein